MRWMVLVVLVGCSSSSSEPAASDPGPRSGLAADTRVSDLSDADREALCTWWGETLGGVGRSQGCSECNGDACTDWNVAVSTLDDCVAWLRGLQQCAATVEDAENCAFAQQPDLCASPSACDPFDGC